MKKYLLIFTLAILSCMLFTSCEKEPLSEFIIGKWESQELFSNDEFGTSIVFMIQFEPEYCILESKDGFDGKITDFASKLTYVIDDNTHVIRLIPLDQGAIVYTVFQYTERNMMIWKPVSRDLATMVWSRK